MAHGTHKKKVLLVDDSSTVLSLEQIMLESSYEILTAGSGTEGLQVAVNERPDLILLDVMMPKLDGFELCRILRNIRVTKDIPIIMVTTLGDDKSQQTAFAAGCNDYISKPIDRSELVTKILRCLQPRSPEEV